MTTANMSSIAGGDSATRAPATPVASKADSAAVTTWPRPQWPPSSRPERLLWDSTKKGAWTWGRLNSSAGDMP